MANVAHSTLTGSNLHENKGVASATDNTVATAVSGATVWAKLTASNLTGTGNPFGAQLYHGRDSKSSGTSPASLSAASWNTLVINTSVTNEISASLSSNQITLASGTYYVVAHSPFIRNGNSGFGKLRLRNITAGSTLITGPAVQCPNTTSGTMSSTVLLVPLQGRATVSGSTVVELQMYVNANSDNGVATSTGENEVYSEIFIWKIG